jgi:hypothetical protein
LAVASKSFDYTIRVALEELLIGKTMSYWVLFLPRKLQDTEPFAARKRMRMRGTANGQSVSLAWQLSSRRHYVMFGRTAAKALGIALGQQVELAFSLVSDAEVLVPEELAEALRQEPSWRKAWRALTPGKQRGLCHMVNTAKDPERRAQRAVDILRAVEAGNVPGPPKRGAARPAASPSGAMPRKARRPNMS